MRSPAEQANRAKGPREQPRAEKFDTIALHLGRMSLGIADGSIQGRRQLRKESLHLGHRCKGKTWGQELITYKCTRQGDQAWNYS